MNRRKMFKLLPALPVVIPAAALANNNKKLDVRLPRHGDYNWGEILNNAIAEIQEELNKRN